MSLRIQNNVEAFDTHRQLTASSDAASERRRGGLIAASPAEACENSACAISISWAAGYDSLPTDFSSNSQAWSPYFPFHSA